MVTVSLPDNRSLTTTEGIPISHQTILCLDGENARRLDVVHRLTHHDTRLKRQKFADFVEVNGFLDSINQPFTKLFPCYLKPCWCHISPPTYCPMNLNDSSKALTLSKLTPSASLSDANTIW